VTLEATIAAINLLCFGGFRAAADDPPKPWRRWVCFLGTTGLPVGLHLRRTGHSRKPGCFSVGNLYFEVQTHKPKWVDTVFSEYYRREVFDRVGLFNENLVRGQDMEFSLRLKKQVERRY